MTDIYVCCALMAFGFAVLGTTWIILEGIPIIRRYLKKGKHEKPR